MGAWDYSFGDHFGSFWGHFLSALRVATRRAAVGAHFGRRRGLSGGLKVVDELHHVRVDPPGILRLLPLLRAVLPLRPRLAGSFD